MNISLKSFSLKGSRAAQLTRFRVIYPERDWLIGLCVGTCILSVGAGVAGWRFLGGLQQLEMVPTPTETRAIYNHARVQQVLTEYQARAKRFETLYMREPASIVPPVVNVGGGVLSLNATTVPATQATTSGSGVAEEGTKQVE